MILLGLRHVYVTDIPQAESCLQIGLVMDKVNTLAKNGGEHMHGRSESFLRVTILKIFIALEEEIKALSLMLGVTFLLAISGHS